MSDEKEKDPVMDSEMTPQEEQQPVVEPQEEAVAKVEEEQKQEEQKVEASETKDATQDADEAIFEKEQPVKKEPKAKKQFKSVYPDPADFDWNAVGKTTEVYSDSERSSLEDMYAKTMKSIDDHEVLTGTVVGISPREVIINIGFKSDGMIPRSEVRYNKDLKVGDTIKVYVENQEDATGQLMLSHKKARLLESWDRVNEAFDNGEIITGLIKWRTKGGLVVDIFGIEAFLPGSQIDVRPIRDYDVFVGKTMEFKVVKINHEYKNVVVSHKALIEDEIEAQKAEIIASLEKGQILEGTVKNITSYGVFVDLGGVDGLIHITDLSWKRINHPEEVVNLDEKIKVVILDFDDTKKRIALGLKQLTPHPWDTLDPNLQVGDKVKGRVTVIADYGAFVEIATGVEGLIHVSEMSWSQHLRTAQDFLKVGDEVEAVVLTLDREDRKMSMGIKQLIPDPWSNITEKYPVNSKHVATVRNFTNFGIFVELEEGVDGLIHISDLSWSKKIKHPAEFTKIGEKIEVVVMDIDVENRRLSLGHKQLEENPWDTYEGVFSVDSVHEGTVTQLGNKGAIIVLPYNVEGFAPLRYLKKEDGKTAKEGEILSFKVIEFSRDNRRIVVSHSALHEEALAASRETEAANKEREVKNTESAIKQLSKSIEKSTLGDLDVLVKVKEEMVEGEKNKLEEMEKKKVSKKSDKKEEAPETSNDSPETEEKQEESEV